MSSVAGIRIDRKPTLHRDHNRPQADYKDIILTVNVVEPALVRAVKIQSQILDRPLKGLSLVHAKYARQPGRPKDTTGLFEEIICDFDNPYEVENVLLPYSNKILAATCRYEEAIQPFSKIIPFLEDVYTPCQESLVWSTEKPLMRDRLREYDETLVPRYRNLIFQDLKHLDEIVKDFKFPIIIKPSGLSKALLVSKNNNKKELKTNLAHTFSVIKSVYDREQYPGVPSVLIEEMMEGEMYSVDVYVMPDGNIHCLPLVQVVTAHSVGLPGFYGYERLIPTNMHNNESADAFAAARSAVRALKLTSTTAHVEMFRTKDGWKIIEVAPRIGGFRDALYREAYGIEHFVNDLSVRMGQLPSMPTDPIGHAAVLNIYPEQEGYIHKIAGIDKAKAIRSVKQLDINTKEGELALFSSNGGNPVLEVLLANKNSSFLREDIEKTRQLISITTVS